jgi:TonB family protein
MVRLIRAFLALLLLLSFTLAALPQDGSTSSSGTADIKAKTKVVPPKALETPSPEPMSSDDKGHIVFKVTIGTDGLVHDPILIKSTASRRGDANALATIKKWRFKPAMKDGVPIPVMINIEITQM